MPKTPPIELHTPRLILRQWRASDYQPFAQLNGDPEVMRHFPATLSRPESNAMADTIRRLINKRGWGLWAVEVPERAPFIGFVGLHVPTPDLPCAPCVEIGWRLARAHWGHGYATEAAIGALVVGFEVLELDEIVSFTPTGNRRSRAVMERLGMRHDGECFEHPHMADDGRLRTHVLYRLTQQEWLQHPRASLHPHNNTPESPVLGLDMQLASN